MLSNGVHLFMEKQFYTKTRLNFPQNLNKLRAIQALLYKKLLTTRAKFKNKKINFYPKTL